MQEDSSIFLNDEYKTQDNQVRRQQLGFNEFNNINNNKTIF